MWLDWVFFNWSTLNRFPPIEENDVIVEDLIWTSIQISIKFSEIWTSFHYDHVYFRWICYDIIAFYSFFSSGLLTWVSKNYSTVNSIKVREKIVTNEVGLFVNSSYICCLHFFGTFLLNVKDLKQLDFFVQFHFEFFFSYPIFFHHHIGFY